MKFIVMGFVQTDEKVNPEKFGDWIRAQRKKYVEVLGTDKVSLLVV